MMIDLGLQRISRLMADTPMPWRAIHVAGTNGKGSVCAYIFEMLSAWNKSNSRQALGRPPLSCGRFTSPFLVDPWDCISFSTKEHGTKPISSGEYHNIMYEVAERNRKQAINATSFELLTATAFEAFTRAKVDVAVVEVGMGGRLDSTNIIGMPIYRGDDIGKDVNQVTSRAVPLVSVITKIGLDHQGFLGNTIEEIAREKAGIIKSGVPVVYDGSNQQSVRKVLESVAAEKSASISAVEIPLDGPRDIPGHRLQNHAVARQAVSEALKQMGIEHDQLEPFIATLSNVRTITFPGRQEQIDLGPLLDLHTTKHALLDGAHNAQSAAALGDYLDRRHESAREASPLRRPITWILAASDSKDMSSILRPLIRNGDNVFAVEFGPVESMEWVRPMGSDQIVALAAEAVPALATTRSFGTDIPSAIRAAAGMDHDIVITGSLYLVGDVHRLLRRHADELNSPS